MILFNGDLTGRVVSVDADAWTEEELKLVISTGEALLNVSFPAVFINGVVSESLGSVYIVQECCRRLCEDNSVVETMDANQLLDLKKPVGDYVRDVVKESGPRYSAFLNSFAEGFQDTQLKMYRWLLKPILKSSIVDLERGLTYRFIREALEECHPNGFDLNPGNVTQALTSVPALQAKKNIKPFVLDYDQVDKRLSVVDRGFLIWLSTQNSEELMEELEISDR